MNSSSSWSTTSTREERELTATAATRDEAGSLPGVSTVTVSPAATRAGTSPARTIEDLPDPDGPATTSSGESRSARRQSRTSSSRPKNHSESSRS